MLDDLFIFYANNSFRENPENLYKLFDKIYFSMSPASIINKTLMPSFIEKLITFSRDNDVKIADKRRNELHADPFLTGLFDIDIAYNAVYRYRNGYCPVECIKFYGSNFAEIAENLEYGGNRRLKCFECWQIYFRSLLAKLISGINLVELGFPQEINVEDIIKKQSVISTILKDYSAVGTVLIDYKDVGDKNDVFISNGYDSFTENVMVVNDFELHRTTYMSDYNLFGENSVYPRNRFNEYIAGLVGYSLINFMLENERGKLKQCSKCDKFFIASKNDSRIKFCMDCSPKDKKSKEERAEYQRQYRFKKKQEKMTEDREARIKKIMKRTGFSRGEVIEMIEADSMM
jgi:hypothetical protein